MQAPLMLGQLFAMLPQIRKVPEDCIWQTYRRVLPVLQKTVVTFRCANLTGGWNGKIANLVAKIPPAWMSRMGRL